MSIDKSHLHMKPFMVIAVLVIGQIYCSHVALAQDASAKWKPPIKDNSIYKSVIADQLEYRSNEGQEAARWDVQAWVGVDYHKLWIKTEGERRVSNGSDGDAELQLLYSRMISPFWDVQFGWRYDKLYEAGPDPSRSFAVVSLQGLAPYWFETEIAAYLSEDGDISGRLTASYELLLTQRLVAQPRLEINAAAQSVAEFGVGDGLNDINLGLRLRYEIRREFAPYVGVEWSRLLGDTADLARLDGENADVVSFVTGVRLYF